MAKIDKATAKAAADWWVKKLGGDPSFDNGDAVAGALAHIAADGAKRPAPTALQAFGDELAKVLESRNSDWLSFGVDYGPDYFLAEIAERLSLRAAWPWKTTMYIRGGKVAVAEGYGADSKQIWPKA